RQHFPIVTVQIPIVMRTRAIMYDVV
ncbi:MAG: hypothetical protein JWM99_1877, partial [Verrucomicrobiales bacterium]|nr:hypothetical protein [Verrucomicrobiales bacterium]